MSTSSMCQIILFQKWISVINDRINTSNNHVHHKNYIDLQIDVLVTNYWGTKSVSNKTSVHSNTVSIVICNLIANMFEMSWISQLLSTLYSIWVWTLLYWTLWKEIHVISPSWHSASRSLFQLRVFISDQTAPSHCEYLLTAMDKATERLIIRVSVVKIKLCSKALSTFGHNWLGLRDTVEL